jgi:hypothetical protein
MSKRTIERLGRVTEAVNQLRAGLEGKPFSWGAHEADSKQPLLERLGYVLVSKTKLEKGGHELKRGAKPVGKRYYNAPLKRYADLYLLGEQTRRSYKWWDLGETGKALLEDGGYYDKRKSFWVTSMVPLELVKECEAAIKPILNAHRDAQEKSETVK